MPRTALRNESLKIVQRYVYSDFVKQAAELDPSGNYYNHRRTAEKCAIVLLSRLDDEDCRVLTAAGDDLQRATLQRFGAFQSNAVSTLLGARHQGY